ncbi:MAG: undecaprenyl-diphosphate phosphatase, partial [Bdellovibrionota bacterium]
MTIFQIIILAVLQGLAELLPVSSSAHVILAQHAMGLDPSAPEMTFLLVMLHTGTMFAVLLYFAKRWLALLQDPPALRAFVKSLVIATLATGVLGLALKFLIEHVVLEKMLGHSKGEVEALFAVLPLVAASLFVAGVLIVIAGLLGQQNGGRKELNAGDAWIIGLAQGLCLPFRGLSRSGTTISASLLRGVARPLSEDFSFALAVLLTPAAIALEGHRLLKNRADLHESLGSLLTPGLIGMFFSFLAGLVALKWLSSWLEKGRWQYFGFYCVVLAV